MRIHGSIWAVAVATAGSLAHATEYTLTSPDAQIFGDTEVITAFGEDTLPDLARRYSLGYEEIQRANPGVDLWLPGEGQPIVIPGQRLLPPGPHEGIVVNLPEHRLYYYPKVKKGETPYVITYPVSIGKMDWSTPLGKTKVNAEPAKAAAGALRDDDIAVLMNALQQEGRLIVGHVGPPRETAPPTAHRVVAEDEPEGGCGRLPRVEDVADPGTLD